MKSGDKIRGAIGYSNTSDKPKQTIKISLTIFLTIISIGLIVMIFMATTENNTPLKKTAPEDNLTLSELLKQGEEEGYDFCNKIEREDLKKSCIESYLLNKSKTELDASICEQSDNEIFVKMCQYNAILPVVAKTYIEESHSQNNSEVVPSNVELCEQIKDEADKILCKNPKQAIVGDYWLLD